MTYIVFCSVSMGHAVYVSACACSHIKREKKIFHQDYGHLPINMVHMLVHGLNLNTQQSLQGSGHGQRGLIQPIMTEVLADNPWCCLPGYFIMSLTFLADRTKGYCQSLL